MLSRHPDILRIEWSSGWTLLPGHLRVSGLKIDGQNPQQQWSFSVSRGEVHLAPGRLFFKTLQFKSLSVHGVTAAVHRRISDAPASTGSPGPLNNDPLSATRVPKPHATAVTGKPLASERPINGAGWAITVNNAEIAQIRELKIDDYRFNGQGLLQLDDVTFRPDGSLAMGRILLQLHSGILMAGSQSIAQELQSNAELRLDPFIPGQHPGAEAFRFVSGRIGVTGNLASFRFINRYLSDIGWLRLNGNGLLKGDIRIERGRLMNGSELSIESPDLTVELDEQHAAGSGERHRIRGAGRLQGDVRATPGGGETRLQVELKDIAMRTQPQDTLFLQGKAFHMSLTGPPVNLSERFAEPAVLMQWKEAVIPDITALNAYFPGRLPFRLVSGRARMNGYLAYANQVVSGKFDLAGEEIAGTLLKQSVIGNLGVELHLKQADLAHRRLDLSGTRIKMQAAHSAAGGAGSAHLRTELKIVQAQLESTLPLYELKRFAGQPPLSGVLKMEGKVANIDFLSSFLPDRNAIEFGGDGHLRADLHLSNGRLVSGSTLTIKSDRLVSRFLGFSASGAGGVSTELRQLASGEEIRMDMTLRDMRLRKVKGGKLFLRGKQLQLTAASPPVDIRKQRNAPNLEIRWQDALMPDVALLNDYLPGKSPFSLGSGSARTSGRLNYAKRRLSGSINLTGEKISGMLLQQPIDGKLTLDLVIKQADLATRLLDLSGTRIQMQTASPTAAKAPLQTVITIKEAHLKARPDSHRAARPGILSPVSGVVRLEGSVANIGFINSFLHSAQGLAFSGDGRIKADLQLDNGQMAPGSRLEIESTHLVSRFLNFEASGAGILTAAVEGKPEAPVGRIGSVLQRFDLRRLDESVPYISGRGFQITTVGKRFNSMQDLRNLNTLVKLTSAEIPDISIYNAYLPKDAGVSIVSGKGKVTADFRLRGVSGSGNLEMLAKGVEVHVRDQTIKGDLRISTRLTNGNLEAMTFDASGTQLRIDNGSLESGSVTRDEQWWGQINVTHGRMTWKRPLHLDATINLQLRDSGLLVHLFVKQAQGRQWLNDLLTIRDVTGESQVLLNDNSIVLKNTRLSGEKLLVLATLRLSEEKIRGGMFAKYGIMGIGVELKDDERTLKLVNPKKWYEKFSEAFKLGPR